MAENAKLSSEEKKRLEATYGSVSDDINPATGFAYGTGIGNVQKLAQATSGISGGSSGGKSGLGGYSQSFGTLSYGDSTADYIARLTDSMNAANSAALRQQYNASLKALESSRAAIGPEYYAARNRAAAENAQSSRNYAEYAAARGIGTGAAAQSAIAREAAYRTGLGNISRDEAKAYADIETKKYQLKAGLESELARALADGEYKKYQMLLEQYRIDRENEYQSSRDAENSQRWQAEFDYQSERDRINDQRYDSEWDYKLGQTTAKAKASTAKTSAAPTAAKISMAAMPDLGKYDGLFAQTPEVKSYSNIEEPISAYLGEKAASDKPFSNNRQQVIFEAASKIWKRFYEIGFDAFSQTVDYLKNANASKTVIKAVFNHLPGFAGLNAWYYAIEYGGLDRGYYESK